MVHFEFGQDRLTQPHPLNMFELAQGAIKVPFEARFRNAYCLTASLDTLVLPRFTGLYFDNQVYRRIVCLLNRTISSPRSKVRLSRSSVPNPREKGVATA